MPCAATLEIPDDISIETNVLFGAPSDQPAHRCGMSYDFCLGPGLMIWEEGGLPAGGPFRASPEHVFFLVALCI
jgi:hypothetical protein